MMRHVLVFLVSCSLLLFFFLGFSTENSPLLTRYFWVFVLLDILFSLVSVVLIFLQIKNLVQQYRCKRFGARLKMRLVLLVTGVSFFPGVVIYLLSIGFVTHSIESWFNVRVDKALDSSVKLGRDVLNTMLYNLRAHAQDAVDSLQGHVPLKNSKMSEYVLKVKESSQADSAFVINKSRHILWYSSGEDASLEPRTLPEVSQLHEARTAGGVSVVHVQGESYSLVVIMPLALSDMSQLFLVLQKNVPVSLSRSLANVEEGSRGYTTLAFSRVSLKRLYILSLTLVLLLILLFAVLAAIYYSDLLAAPLFMLFEGTEAVAHGDFSPRQVSGGTDELSLLTRLFYQMTYQLGEARELAERKSVEIEQERSYLSSLLKTLTTGVMTFDAQFKVKEMNKSACDILGDDCLDLLALPLPEWTRLSDISDVILSNFSLTHSSWRRQHRYATSSSEKYLLMRGGCFNQEEEGYVVVFDDLTPLVHAQKMMVWGEVAKRLAHEIKNPLMPIRLSAERLHFKLSSKLCSEDQLMLERATHLIVRQVDAMKDLINDFRDLTDFPSPSLLPVPIGSLISEVSALYEHDNFRIFLDLDGHDINVLADERQIRQVLHNLLCNALDAVADETDPRVHIRLFSKDAMSFVVVSDNGIGFPKTIMKNLFDPYVTSKPGGTGLGLAIVKKIIDEHNGTVVVNSGAKGSSVTFTLPCVRQ